jgi:hypothetical protein
LEQKYHLEKWVKRGKEKQPTESRVQSDDWRKKRNGQHDSPMVRDIQPWQWASWSK